ncbi:peroxiredoxin-like family protein [Sandarakinorhabdus oryzae]|uniref:peroxiredoxin-like family protein n=1 Tax=Sandarakinorhabdus oryzae TaxID=2675220 RepID=UPI0012E11F1E|nr:peroxiredoxin-like family protein [Sandarakinorhabdus oryzae]
MAMDHGDPLAAVPGPRTGPVVVDPIWHVRADQLVSRLQTLGCGRKAPAAGQIFPDFVLPDWRGRLTSLADMCRDGPVVLSFHRGLWCPWCRAELDSWQDAWPDLRQSGCRLVVVTPETGALAAAMAARVGEAAHVLCDVDFGVSTALGLTYFMGHDLMRAYTEDGLDLVLHYGAASGILPIPATFVIEVGRRVRFAHVDIDFRRRADPAAVLAALRL